MSVVSRLSDWPRTEARHRTPRELLAPGAHVAEIHILPCVRRERPFEVATQDAMDVAQSA